MIHQELLRDATESYLKSLICEVSSSIGSDFDSSAPFGELGIDSFHVLKVIRRLEADFGTLPKSLLFENFTVTDLAGYFVDKHEPTLSAKFAGRVQRAEAARPVEPAKQVEPAKPVAVAKPVVAPAPVAVQPAAVVTPQPIRILEKDAYAHPELGPLVRGLFERHKVEACVSRGTRKIGPNLFIGSTRRGYFNYGRSRSIILVYGFTGPREYLPELMEEMHQYCEANGFQFNMLAGGELPQVGGRSFTATPFGAMQRIRNLQEFKLDGGPMRRLRYQVSKFEKTGICRTDEYRCGDNPEIDNDIVRVIDRWCEARTMVNPLVRDVREEILAGHLPTGHRLFLTYLDGELQNVIMISALSDADRGYLMDLEFYPPDMPLGGLEFAIVQIIQTLVGEGCDLLSLGGTYGCKLEDSPTADPEIDKVLDTLRDQNIFNDQGNLQFKNKFRPENQSIFLCRLQGAGNPENVTDIIMMIADPEEMQTPDTVAEVIAEPIIEPAVEPVAQPIVAAPLMSDVMIEGNERSRTLAEFGFNPLGIPSEGIELDLKTDSWAQLDLPAIDAQMKRLHTQLQQPVSVDDSLRAVFPFAHFVLTASGQAAEHVFFKAWQKKGVVLQNLLFPSTIFHQIDNGFTPKELPHASLFALDSQEPYKANLNHDALQAALANERDAIAFVCIELCDNAAGGAPVSLQHLREVKALLAPHAIPLVLDITRIVENAQYLVEHEAEHAGRSVWTVVREILSCADAVIGSLTKDFCVSRGGLVATNDTALFQRLQELVQEDGGGIDLIDRKMIALSLQSRTQIETKVLRRVESVRRIWTALREHDVPVVQPAGGHCVLIDVKQLAELRGFKDPVASFVAWLYLNTGIRAAAHSVGMQKHTALNDLVRLAIPVGLERDVVDAIIERLVTLFANKINIPELAVESAAAFGTAHATYRLVRYHNPSGNLLPLESAAAEVVTAEAGEPAAETPVSVEPKPRRTTDVAIVGMAGRYPKAKNLRELWENLSQGKDCIEDLPAERYERRLQYGAPRKYRGGFIDDVDRFDSLFFNISPREAEWLDPQERLFLEVAWEAMEDAGYYPEILGDDNGARNIGVYVGAVWAMYQMLGVEEKHAGNSLSPNSFLWSIANRVSYCLNLSGPSLTVDTACSSSLTALYLAYEAIQSGDCSAAIVGGVNLDLHQTKFDINHNGGALSPDGVCRTFGKGANGYVAGEGIGAIVLKPLDQAIRNGDNIYGVIKAAAVNHGGRTSGYTVPNPKAQSELISAALQKAGVDARSIGYVEAHGTGTELGDPIEITGLTTAFKSSDVANQSCAIGSIKSNIGHLEAAAGVVSVSKVLLQMKHRQLAPSLHSAELNEFIDFEQSPFYVVQKLEEWTAREVGGVRTPLRAGISSFGAGGANAHIILESWEPSESEAPAEARPLLFPLSARNEEQLREAALRLSRFLRQSSVRLNDVAFTLQQGRKSFEHRAAIIATTREELIEKLSLFAEGKKNQDVVTGHAKSGDGITRLLSRREKQEFVRLVAQGHDAHKLAGLWTEGLLADWQGFQSETNGKRISLPTYPFADKRHWAAEAAPAKRALQTAAGVHPLVDTNESTFERQLFKKTFHDRDFFIYDHYVSDIPTLPGVAYLELARKAGELAAGRKVQKIRNILWVSPIAVQNGVPKEVYIELRPAGDAVQFEVFSEGPSGSKTLHSQGKLIYATNAELEAAPEFIELDAIRARCQKVTDGPKTYPLFKQFGLNLGPSFQVLQDVFKGDAETLGALQLPEFRKADLETMVLQPSLMDGSLQAGVGAQLAGEMGEMFVPYSIGEVEILHPLEATCFSYITPVKGEESSRVLKSNAVIVDATGRVLVKVRESVGVPLREVHEKPKAADADGFANLYYAYDWEQAPLSAVSANAPVVLFANDDTLRANAGQIIVRPGDAFMDLGDHAYTVNPKSKDDFAQLFESLIAKGTALDNVVFAWPLAGANIDESLERGVYSFLFLTQALIKHKLDGRTQLLYVYSQTEDGAQPQHEAVTGFVHALRLEHPKLLCRTVEVRGESILDAVSTEVAARVQDANAVRYDGRERSIRKLEAFPLEAATDATPATREQGVYLITGGAGGLGLIFAEFLAKECKARLVLTGRSKLSAGREAKLDELRALGAEVVYLIADVANENDVRALVAECKARFGQLNGIVHSAGVLRDSFLRNKTADEMGAVFAPKVYGTLHLDALTKDEPLDFFVTFSSLAAVAGNAGQCDYAFANFFMDSFAAGRERLRAAGTRSGRTLSVNWSIWADGGMKLDDQTELFFRKNLGIRPLSIATGTDAFMRGLASGRSQVAVLEAVQDKIETAWGLRKKAPAPAAPATGNASAPAAAATGDLAARLQADLTQIVMKFLKLDASDVDADKILLDLGFDSIGLTTFANAINEKYGLDITPVLFFDYASLGEISKYLAAERKDDLLRVYGAPAATNPVSSAVTPQSDTRIEFRKGWSPAPEAGTVNVVSGGLSPERRFLDQPIAIVGMSGVMPQSDDLDEFWENLRNSKDMITVIPPDRWRWEDYYGDPLKEANKSNSKWGGFMREVDKFDPLFFGISPREATMMDPQQRIFLEHCWKAVEDSGQKVSDLAGTRTGVFVGVATTDYTSVINQAGIALDGYTAAGNSHSILANRVSFLLGLRGPSAPVDTACSSSLVALHRAIESIHTGSSDMAIVGGVQVMLSPAAYISFGMAGMMSGDGKCKTFDKDANGYVRGEGCGAIFLKPLAAAERDGNHIHAVIRATAENHGGKVTIMTAPNAAAQAELLIEAYESAEIDPATVGYIECHGTGTPLGDPIEIQALTKAFSELYKKRNKVPAAPHVGLSSVKTNIGHLETGAGIAGILKVLLAIRNKQIPANLHLQEVNPYIKLEGTPFYIADKLTQWDAATAEDGSIAPRRAGVSSFGFGGANAHIVLEEYIPSRRAALPQTPQLVVLSAKNDERLTAYARSLQSFVAKKQVELCDVAYTLQTGRDEMPARLALVVSTVEELQQKLAAVLEGNLPADCFRGIVRNATASAADARSNELAKLGELWVAGAKIDWRPLHENGASRRISVPTYPFARDRYWIEGKQAAAPLATARLHPLVHRNVSTLKEQKFASRFTGTEFFLADHRVKSDSVLPGVAYIELVAAAAALSGDQPVRVIRDLVWSAPFTVGNSGKEVEVSLAPSGSDVEFTVKSSVTHCRGKLAYGVATPAVVDVARLQSRCNAGTISATDLYAFLGTSELNLGRSFQVVQRVHAGRNECLAVLQLPEHLKGEADEFRLHPALLDGGVHTAIGVIKKTRPEMPWSVPYSVGEIELLGSLKDVHYAHAAWDAEGTKTSIQFLDRNGNVLVRMNDFVSKSLRPAAAQPELARASLQTFAPVWNAVRPATNALPESERILLFGDDRTQLDWVRADFPNAHFHADDEPGDQLLWIAPQASADNIIEQQEAGVLALFRTVKSLLDSGYANKKLHLTIVVTRTQRVIANEAIQPAHAGIAGFAGSLAKEYANWDLRLVDVESLASVSAREILSLPWDKQGNALARRNGEWFQQTLDVVSALPQAASTYRRHGVYVVIGGAGGIGEVWSRFMIEQYQANIVWIGRRAYDDAIEAKLNALTREGRAPLYITADATNAESLGRAYQRILKTHPAIHGVVHSAIVLGDRSIARMDEATFRASLAAKVDISVNVDRVFGALDLDFLLFFSSIISFFKTPGQSNYAAGCTFKDSFAHDLQQRRPYPVRIMNWGYWGSVGVVADEMHNKLMEKVGLGSIEPAEGMAALQTLMASPVDQVALIKTVPTQPAIKSVPVATVSAGDDSVRRIIIDKLSAALRMSASAIRNDAPFADYGVDSIIGVDFVRAIGDALQIQLEPATLFEYSTVDQLTSFIVANRKPQPVVEVRSELSTDSVAQLIVEKLSAALRMSASAIRNDAPFADYGVDSIVGVDFVRAIGEALRIQLEPASLFEYSTVDQLSRYIVDHFAPRVQAAEETPRVEVVGIPQQRFVEVVDAPREIHTTNAAIEPIAIIGMAGRFAESDSLDAFWRNLEQGKDLVKPVTRWSANECTTADAAGKPYCSHGSFVDSVDRFDPAFFGISAQEATYMDPQQRLFLEESWKALEDAGYAGRSAHEKQCGVYVGCGTSNYSELFVGEPPAQAWWGNSHSVVPARIAYHLNLQGPAIAVDTACSSALVAIHLACQALWSRETEMALAGGVYVQATPGFHQVANRAGMLSPDGRCRSFDASANGFVPGEAVGVVVLKRLSDAIKDGDFIHGVIAGTGINQDGKSNGLIAPNARAQERLERAVYERFSIDPATIQVVEAHATATPFGDTIEYSAISRAFRESTDKTQFCAIGSVKTNIGHAGNAAGIASVLKVLLSLRNRQIPPSLHFEKSNPAIDLASGPFYVNTQLKPWQVEGNRKRRAAVSSFGFSGTNAHLVIEEAPAMQRVVVQRPAYMVVLSARSAEQLQQQAQSLLDAVKQTPNVSMHDLAFTLFTGRAHFAHRLACVARNQEELVRLLAQWLESGSANQVYTSPSADRVREQAALRKFGNYCIRECASGSDATAYVENLAAVAELHAQGYALDFDALFAAGARRMPLPTYPFANERYWVGSETKALAPKVTAQLAAIAEGSLENELAGLARNLLSLGDAEVPLDVVLLDLGFDSIGLTKFAAAINERYQVTITPVVFFDYPTLGAIANYLAGLHVTARPVAPVRTRERRVIGEPVAIVGISGVMPQSDDLDAFWENLKQSKDLISVIPDERWDWEEYFGDPFKQPNTSNSKWGGFMSDVDKFDPLFFGISPKEAQMMDPQQRLFLQSVWKAIEDAGQKVSDLSGTRTGLFVGVGSNDYLEVLRDSGIVMDGYSASGNTHSVLANRVSFLLNLRGPSAPVDTACSSALVALHRAVESIRSGNCDMAIAGGVQVMLSPAPFVAFGVAGMLSGDGRCKTFDKRANGYVRGEGVGALLLKPLSMAEADGNHIYAVIRATAENHGGRVTSMTAPNSLAQAELLVEAYEKAGIDPATVGYIECHGTGTSLGDPIEIQALSKAFADLYASHGKAITAPHCGLGSVKTNIGHLETAAGVAGVFKVLLAMKHKQLPANLHFEELNPYITLDKTPFYVVDRLTPWEATQGSVRRAGVSSFGFGGANAHVVLEEYVAPNRPLATSNEPRLIVLSAKNAERLDAYVRSLSGYVASQQLDLADLAYTLQAGRDEMPERLAVIASSTDELRRKLELILGGGQPEGGYRGRAKKAAGAATGDLPTLAEGWVSGAAIDWSALYGTNTPRRISAPTYPFARERHWIPQTRTPRAAKSDQLQSLVPVWNPSRIETRIEAARSARILVLGNESRLDWVLADYPNAATDLPDFDQLLWIAPEETGDRVIEQQEAGVLAVFRTIKALLSAGYGSRKLQWTFVTRNTQQVSAGDPIQPAHAGIAGLAGSLAKEYPNWDLRVVDLDSLSSVTARECLSLPWDKQGNVIAHRRGEWFQQGMALATATASSPRYRRNGVYVVIGGAGGIGEVWTRHMIEQYQANVVWIGRREYGAAIEAKIESLTRDGLAPMYISADATSYESLEQAFRTIRKTHPVIHGVVHSAIVLRDQSIGRMDEAAFRAGYSAKADISVNIDRVFGEQPLDFLLFFSSIVSFFKSPGQSNYAAGCTFKDAFAQSLQHKRAYPIKIMNWGYWGGVGVASGEAHNKLMAQMGLGSIEPVEGMEALQSFLGSALPQLTLIKTLSNAATSGLSLSDAITYFLTKKLPIKAATAPKPAQPANGVAGYVRRIIGETLSQALSLDAAEIPGDAPLSEYGVDSIAGVNLVRTLNETLEIELEPSKLLDYSTIDDLTRYIADNWTDEVTAKMPRAAIAEPAEARLPVAVPATIGDDILDSGVLENVLWQDALAGDYEKVTF